MTFADANSDRYQQARFARGFLAEPRFFYANHGDR